MFTTPQQKVRVEFTLKTTLAATGLLLGLALTSPAAAVQCGDTIGPNQTATLQEDLLCDITTGGLVVIGPAEVHMDGHAIKCQDLNGIVPSGIEILGRDAKVYGSDNVVFGTVSDCFYGVGVRGEGHHTVENVMAERGREAGFYVASSKNTLRWNYTAQGPSGFVIGDQSRNNKLLDNAALFHDDKGFQIHGTKHQLQRNSAVLNEGHGFTVSGVGHKLTSNIADRNRGDGFGILGNHNHLKNNKAIGNVDGFAIEDVAKNTLTSNEAIENHDDGFDVQGGTLQTALLRNKSFHNGGSGIEVDGQQHKLVSNETLDNNQGNYPDAFDLADENPNCGTNTWKDNTFGTANQPCIQ